jgi:hypothetical protein
VEAGAGAELVASLLAVFQDQAQLLGAIVTSSDPVDEAKVEEAVQREEKW